MTSNEQHTNDFEYYHTGAKYMQQKVLEILGSTNNYDNSLTLNDYIDLVQALLPGTVQEAQGEL